MTGILLIAVAMVVVLPLGLLLTGAVWAAILGTLASAGDPVTGEEDGGAAG